MLTVADTLKLKPFTGAKIVAGSDGLDTPVVWVHTTSVPDAAQWLNGGELLLVTANNLPADNVGQSQYIKELTQKKVAGLVVAVGRMIDHVSDAMRVCADEEKLPLIEIAYTTRFVDLARTANERIAQENMALVRRSLDIHRALTQLVLEGGGVRDLAQLLTRLINQSVSIETERFAALASVNIAAVDEARRYTQQHGRTDPRLVEALEEWVLPDIRRTLQPVFIPKMPDVGLEMERILAPIVVHGEIYGFVWIIADDRPLDDIDRVAIESAATIAALMMLHQQSIQSAEAEMKGNLLTRLIQGEMSGFNVLTDQALRYGVDLKVPYRLLMVEYPQATSQRLLRLYRETNHVVATRDRNAIVGQYASNMILLIQASEDPDRIIEDLRSTTSREGKARIGVSGAHHGARQVRLAYKQAREVLDITRKLGTHGPNVYFDDLGYIHALYHAGPEALESNAYAPGLRKLVNENQANLFNTLEVYLNVGGNGVAAAEALHIHRSTLNYRLSRIAELCGFELSDPTTRTNLQVALKLLRLFEVG